MDLGLLPMSLLFIFSWRSFMSFSLRILSEVLGGQQPDFLAQLCVGVQFINFRSGNSVDNTLCVGKNNVMLIV